MVPPIHEETVWSRRPEAEFLDVTETKVLKVFLRAIRSHLN